MKTKTTLIRYAAIFLMVMPFFTNAKNENSNKGLHTVKKKTSENIVFETVDLFWGQRVSYTPDFPNKENIVSYSAENLPYGISIDTATGLVHGVPATRGFGTDYNNYKTIFTANYQDGTIENREDEFNMMYPRVAYFVLIDSNTDMPIPGYNPIPDYATIDITEVGENINIRAVANFEENVVASDYEITFNTNGAFFRKESIAPYAMGGDISGNYLDLSYEIGDYLIVAETNSKPLGGKAITYHELRLKFIKTDKNAPIITGYTGELPSVWGEEADFQIEASDPNNDQLTYFAEGLPPGLSIDPDSGKVTGCLTISKYNGSSTYARVTITVTDPSGLSATTVLTIPIFARGIESFSLINADTDTIIPGYESLVPFSNNPINLSVVGKHLNIRANTGDAICGGAVKFELDGKEFRTENVFPYALAGDFEGDYYSWTPTEGEHNITAQIISKTTGESSPYGFLGITINVVLDDINEAPEITGFGDDLPNVWVWGQTVDIQTQASDPDNDSLTYSASELPHGLSVDPDSGKITGCLDLDRAGGSSTVFSTTITATDPDGLSGTGNILFIVGHARVESFTLIDADTNAPIPGYDPLDSSNNTIDLSVVGTNLNIRANTDYGPVCGGALKFELDGIPFRTENFFPYTLAGDFEGDYYSWTPMLGSHTISAEIISKTTGQSDSEPYSISINVLSGSSENTVSLYPNPSNDFIQFDFQGDQKGRFYYRVGGVGNQGSLLKGFTTVANSSIDIRSLPQGLYVIELTSEKGAYQQALKFLKN